MGKRFLFSVLLISSAQLYSQQAWELKPNIERNAYSILEGSIDAKYPISMYLEVTWNYCGPNDNYKWNPRIIKGWYEYKRIGKKIPLIGSINGGDNAEYYLKMYVPENVLDTLDGKTCTLDKFKEMFFIPVGYYSERYSMDSMQWTNHGEENFHPVYLKEVHPSTWKTLAALSFKVDNIELLKIDLSKLASNEFIDKVEVEAVKEFDGNFYFIVRFGHLTTPGWFGSGQCGAGWEEWLAFIQINNSLEVEKFEYFQNESCYKLIEADYSFNKEHPEYGIIVKKY